jgi:hypothetical protein
MHIRVAIDQAKEKQSKMFFDTKLYESAFSSPNPAVTGTNTTWLGHADDLRGRIATIHSMIGLGRLMGCDVTAEESAARTLFVASAPWR